MHESNGESHHDSVAFELTESHIARFAPRSTMASESVEVQNPLTSVHGCRRSSIADAALAGRLRVQEACAAMRCTTHCQGCGTPPARRAGRCALRRAGYHGRYWRRHSCESVMRQPLALVDAASPPHVVQDEPPRHPDWRYDWRTVVAS